MRWVGILMWCVGVTCMGSACGYLDEDLAKSDEEFAASFGTNGVGGSVSGFGLSGGRGCSVAAGTSVVHSGHGTLGRPRAHRGLTTLHLSASYITASAGQNAAHGVRLAVVETDEPPAPAYAGGELETWGDYLEAELERARRLKQSK